MSTQIIEKALSKKGQFASVEYARPCKVLKNAPQITKSTKATNIRIGCEYDALKSTLENKGVETKEQAHQLNQGLKGMEFVQYPVVLKSVKTDKQYIRVETNKNTKFETTYMMDGVQVNKKDIEQYLQASEKKSSGELPSVLNIGVDYITSIK